MADYWSRTLIQRLSRRKAIAATTGLSLSAALLAACGGGKNNSAKTPAKSSLVSEPVDTTASAKPGGTIKDYYKSEILHFDAATSNTSSVVNDVSVFGYSRMLKFALAKYPKASDGSVEGDMMESYEISPDKLTYTFKLRQVMKWDSRAPTSSRAVDTQDVLTTWKRFTALNPASVNLAYDEKKAPSASIESMTAPDDKTIVLKLRQPDAALLTVLAGWDQFYIMPREADGGFDPRTTVRGYAPWILDEYRPSAFIHWKKNPDYYVKGRPFPDALERPLVPEYATRLSQFKAGNIYTDVVEQSQQDVVQLKKDVPQALLQQGGAGNGRSFNPATGAVLSFGYEGNSVFKDTRLRQAVSMSLDGDAIADVIENRPDFAKNGLDIPVSFNSNLSPAWAGAWLNPRDDKEFGPNNKYFKFNPSEAKKLITAAGFTNGVDFDFFYNREDTYGAVYAKQVEIYTAMLLDTGMKAKLQGQSYAVFIPQYHVAYIPANFAATKGFAGMALVAERQRYTPTLCLYGMVHPSGDSYHGATPDGMNANKGDPKVTSELDRLRSETDKEKVKAGLADMQRYLAQQAYLVPKPSNSIPYSVWWPVLGNQGAFTPAPVGAGRWAEHNLPWWIDTSKAPIARS